MEKFVLVPEMSPIGFTRSAVPPTLLPALSEVCSLAVLAGGGGVVAAANALAVVESCTARVCVPPAVGSELPTVYVGNGALDVVGWRVDQSCLRMDSEETLPALQDERCVMSFFIGLAAVLISQFVLSYDEFDENVSSLVGHVSGSLVCHVDLDSLWMVPWDNCRTCESGSHTGKSIWRSVMCSVARLSRMPVLPDTGGLKSFGKLGR